MMKLNYSIICASALTFLLHLSPQALIALVSGLYNDGAHIATIQAAIELTGISPQIEIDPRAKALGTDLELIVGHQLHCH